MKLRHSDVVSGPPQPVFKLLKLLDGRVGSASRAERLRLLKALTVLFLHVGPDAATVDLFDDLFVRLCDGLDTSALVALAEALASSPAAPPATVRMLAYHSEMAVAGPVLARSPALGSDDLAALAASVGHARLVVMCGRPTIEAALSAIIVGRDNPAATELLLGNAGVTFTIPDFRVAVSRAVSDSRGRVALRQPVDIFDFAGRKSGRCMTRDISPSGIKIELAGGGRPPDSFMLELPGIGHARLTCRYVWHRDSMVGALLQEPLFDQLATQQDR